MARDLFSVPIYFIVFRETLEAAIIISVLLGLVEQIVHEDPGRLLGEAALEEAEREAEKYNVGPDSPDSPDPSASPRPDEPELPQEEDRERSAARLIKKMRLQIFLGGALGLLIALSIGAAFIAVWFTQAADLWSNAESLWEGIFELIASILIFVMGVTMLKMDRAKIKWRVKLQRAFAGKHTDRGTRAGKWMLFILPCITVLREAMEAVVFVGGVSLGQPAVSIPIAAVAGLITGLIGGVLIYAFASRTTLTVFMVVMTNLVLLIGAGLFSQCVYQLQSHAFDDLVGSQVDDTAGDGPGSFDVRQSVWHIDCCNPENNFDNGGWMIFNAVLGWTNSASIGTILAYVFYWLAVMVTLVTLKFKEGRTNLLGRESAAGRRRRERQERAAQAPISETASSTDASSSEKEKVPLEETVAVEPRELIHVQ